MDNMVNVIEPLQTALVASITPGQIVVLLASIIGVGMAFVLMWFGVRKLVSIFKTAVMGGNVFDAISAYGRYQYHKHQKGYNSAKVQSFKEWYYEDLYYYR